MSKDIKKHVRTQGKYADVGKIKSRDKKQRISPAAKEPPDKKVHNRHSNGSNEPNACLTDENVSPVKYEENSGYCFNELQETKKPTEILDAGSHVLSKTDNGESMIFYEPQFFEEEEAEDIFNCLYKPTDWHSKNIVIQGVEYPQPRMVAWYGPHPYSYSGATLEPAEMPESILKIKRKIEQYLKENEITANFNSVLLNLYRNGKDSVSWHSDDEMTMGIYPTIASVSLGETRKFEMRRKKENSVDESPLDKQGQYFINLTHGSLLIMDGCMQEDWQHRVPKEYHDKEPRINLTFRTVFPLEKIPEAPVKASKKIYDDYNSDKTTNCKINFDDENFPPLNNYIKPVSLNITSGTHERAQSSNSFLRNHEDFNDRSSEIWDSETSFDDKQCLVNDNSYVTNHENYAVKLVDENVNSVKDSVDHSLDSHVDNTENWCVVYENGVPQLFEKPSKSRVNEEKPKNKWIKDEKHPKKSFGEKEPPIKSFDEKEPPIKSFDEKEPPKKSFDEKEPPKIWVKGKKTRSWIDEKQPPKSWINEEKQPPKRWINEEKQPPKRWINEEKPSSSIHEEKLSRRWVDKEKSSRQWVNEEKPPRRWVDEEKRESRWVNEEKPSRRWVNEDKHESRWVNEEKPTKTWVNEENPPESCVNEEKPTRSWVNEEKLPRRWVNEEKPKSWVNEKEPQKTQEEKLSRRWVNEEKPPESYVNEEIPSRSWVNEKEPPKNYEEKSSRRWSNEKRSSWRSVNEEKPSKSWVNEEKPPESCVNEEKLSRSWVNEKEPIKLNVEAKEFIPVFRGDVNPYIQFSLEDLLCYEIHLMNGKILQEFAHGLKLRVIERLNDFNRFVRDELEFMCKITDGSQTDKNQKLITMRMCSIVNNNLERAQMPSNVKTFDSIPRQNSFGKANHTDRGKKNNQYRERNSTHRF